MVGRAIVYRGRSNAVYGLWGSTGDCAWQRAAGTRLGIGAHVADGGHQGGIECRTAARAAETEHDDCNRAGCANHSDHSGRTGAASTEYFCAGESASPAGAPRESRRADHRAGPKSEPIGIVRHSGASRDRTTGCSRGAAGALQRECLYCRLSFIPRRRLHLSAERRATQALFEIDSHWVRSRSLVPEIRVRACRNR